MIGNAVSLFVNGGETKSFTYEGGDILYHFSPYDNKWSKYLDWNIAFHANNDKHARDVLIRIIDFYINCIVKYCKHEINAPYQTNHYEYQLIYLEVWLHDIKNGKGKIEKADKTYVYSVEHVNRHKL